MPPANDNFASALDLTGLSSPRTVTITGATVQAGEPEVIPTRDPHMTTWYKYVPTASGNLVIDTAGSTTTDSRSWCNPSVTHDLDTTLAVYTGTTLTGLTRIAYNDDGPDGRPDCTSLVSVAVTAGVTYWIQAGTFADFTDGVLHLAYGVILALTGSGARAVTDSGGALVPATIEALTGASAWVFTDAGGRIRDALLMAGASAWTFTDAGGILSLLLYGGPWTRDDSQKTVIRITPRSTGRLKVPVVPNPWDGT